MSPCGCQRAQPANGIPPNERWFFRGNRIVGLGGKCLNVQGGGDADGTPIVLRPCSGTPNEAWHVRR